jgi:hypothetical protein
MALSQTSVRKAVNIFEEIAGPLKSAFIEQGQTDNRYDQQKLIGSDKKEDGGWESIFINIKDISNEQLELWDSRKTQINNSSFCNEVQPGITRIGFY